MKIENDNIMTPVYLKTEKDMAWPKDKLFYLLSADGLFLCRNHEWFRSCSPAKTGPGELEEQKPFAHVNYPQIPKTIIEKAAGFFRRIEKDKGWEAALILVWNRVSNRMELVCPDQKCSYGVVKYDIPKLPQHLALIGDIHSHPTFSPTPSGIDKDDEDGRPGLHVIVGYVTRPQPEFHCVTVIDGARFTIKNEDVMDGFETYDEQVPQEWIDKVKPLYKQWSGNYHDGYGGSGGNYEYQSPQQEPNGKDRKVVERVLAGFLAGDERPTWYQVKTALFSQTKVTSYVWCENRAREFMTEWDKAHEKDTQTTATE